MMIVQIGRMQEGTGPCTATLAGAHVLVHVLGSSASDALGKLTRAVPQIWAPRVASVKAGYNLGFGPITLLHLQYGVPVDFPQAEDRVPLEASELLSWTEAEIDPEDLAAIRGVEK